MKTEIDIKELEELKRAASKLDALEAGGVDNWEWYDESLKEWRKEEQYVEVYDSFIDGIHEVMIDDVDYEFPVGTEAGISLTLNEHGEFEIRQLLTLFLKQVKNIENGEY